MNDLKERLMSAIRRYCPEDNIREDCSGRGMYGEECFAITGSDRECRGVLVYVIEMMHDDGWEDFGDAVDLLLGYDQDRLGYDKVYYWPGWKGDQS